MRKTRIVILNSDIASAASVKQALEDVGRFSVTPFTELSAALDFLKTHPQDVVVVNLASAPEGVVQSIVEVQSGAKVIASTSDSSQAQLALRQGAQLLIDSRYTARELLQQVEQLATTSEMDDTTEPQVAEAQQLEESPPKTDDRVFEKLAAEEPPAPSFEDSGTVTDFMAISPEDLDTMMQTASEEDDDRPAEPDRETAEDDLSLTAAHKILETANDDSRSLEQLPFDEYLTSLRHGPQSATDTYVKEPDFLENTHFDEEPQAARPDLTDSPEEPEEPPAPIGSSNVETPQDDIPVPQASPPASEPPIPPPTSSSNAMSEALSGEGEAPSETEADELHWYPEPLSEETDDPQITQMAVSLTQASLESTAEATLLTRGDEFLAYDGAFSDTDISEFMRVITQGWERVGDQQARIRYITLSSNGLDYMIYSRRTHEDFILSMVFAGQTALRDIREQGRRIAEALRRVPEIDVPESTTETDDVEAESSPETNPAARTKPSRGGLRLEAPPEIATVQLVEHAFVWLLRDPTRSLAYPTAEAINAGLRVQLIEQGWKVNALDVEEDYVYLFAGVPGDAAPQQIIRELQERSAQIAHKQNPSLTPQTLWAESYFVLTPGRHLDVQEIQQYINFYRM